MKIASNLIYAKVTTDKKENIFALSMLFWTISCFACPTFAKIDVTAIKVRTWSSAPV